MIAGRGEKDTGKIITPDGACVEIWKVRAYEGLRDNGVVFIDIENSRTFDLCHLGKMLDNKKKIEVT